MGFFRTTDTKIFNHFSMHAFKMGVTQQTTRIFLAYFTVTLNRSIYEPLISRTVDKNCIKRKYQVLDGTIVSLI